LLHQIDDLFELNVKLRCQKVNKSRIDVTVRGVDYEGKFSHFPGELYMLYVLVNGNGLFVERFCRLCDGIFTVLAGIFTILATKVFMVSMYV
jgi:hypothetical protein